MTLWIDPGAGQVLEVLRRAGHKAYLVGGCVRDSLAGRTPRTGTSAPAPGPARPWSCSGRSGASPPGCSTALSPSGQGEGLYEVTTFRVEEGYSDGRHPDRVSLCGGR